MLTLERDLARRSRCRTGVLRIDDSVVKRMRSRALGPLCPPTTGMPRISVAGADDSAIRKEHGAGGAVGEAAGAGDSGLPGVAAASAGLGGQGSEIPLGRAALIAREPLSRDEVAPRRDRSRDLLQGHEIRRRQLAAVDEHVRAASGRVRTKRAAQIETGGDEATGRLAL